MVECAAKFNRELMLVNRVVCSEGSHPSKIALHQL